MTALDQLNAYLQKLELRMRILAATRGAAILIGSAAVITILLAWICNYFAFSSRVVWPARLLLYLSVAGLITFAIVLPLLRMNRRWVAQRAEERLAGFDQRLLTLAERADPADPFSELLAEDALEIAKRHNTKDLAPTPVVVGFVCSGAVAAVALLWLILGAPGYWGYGASLLWAGTPRSSGPLYDISVKPGNKVIRRKADQVVSAQLLGFSASKVTLYARYKDGSPWEAVQMQPQRDSNGYEFLFASLSEPVDYYVAAGQVRSKQFKINVKDLAAVTKLRVAVHYPEYLRIKDQVNDPGGDIRAVEGSQAEVSVLTDRPLDRGVLVTEDGRKLPLKHVDGNWYSAELPVIKNGSYHVAALDSGDTVRLTDDYFIEAKKDAEPTIKIVNPGRDAHVSPIEELPVAVQSADDFGLTKIELHYSVNGGPEQTMPLAKAVGQTNVNKKTLLSFEDFKVVPGDLVSFYATASDAKNTARTDMFFAQADPFDLRFKQSQQAGGGGGGGAGDQNEQISQRQKEIIAATFNELRHGSSEQNAAAEEAKFLSDVEGKLGQQAKTLADRMRSRELSGNNAEFDEFSKQMDRASAEMASAVNDLKASRWRNALSPEQRALQALTRAESLFRDIQIATSRRSGGGGGGGGSAGRDLERMFDLELDPEKNQYETGQSTSASTSQQQKALDDAMEKLKALARRQQELAKQRPPEQMAQQRWEQEMLRREAEELQRQMEQMSKSQQQQQGQSGQSSQQQPSGQQQQSGQSSASSRQRGQQSGAQSQPASSSGSDSTGQQSAAASAQQRQELQQLMNDLKRAQDEMRNAVSQRDNSARQRATNALQAAEDRLRGMRERQSGESMAGLADQSQRMLDQQKNFAQRLRSAAARAPEATPSQNAQSARQYMFRRRYGYNDPYDPARRGLPSGTNSETEQLAKEKEQMANDLERLQRQIQRQSQAAQGDQPDVSSKLRDALITLEQSDLASHMKRNSDWIRQGYGAESWVNEQSSTAALDQANRQIQEARAASERAQGKGGRQGGDEMQRAVQQVQQLQRQLRQEAANPSQADDPSGGATPGGRPAISEAMQNLANLRQRLSSRGGRAYYDSEYAFRFLQDLQGADPNELSRRLNREVLPTLERLEVELKRQGNAPPEGGRVAAAENAPETYRDAVAEYFKKLSK